MIEEQALVCKVQGRQVWVRTAKASACGQCAQQQGCSSAVIENVAQRRELQVESDIPLAEGDTVVLGIDTKQLLQSAALLYFLPLIALLLGGFTGEWVADLIPSINSDIIIVFSALLFFLGSLFLLKRLHRLGLSILLTSPVIIRKL